MAAYLVSYLTWQKVLRIPNTLLRNPAHVHASNVCLGGRLTSQRLRPGLHYI